MEFDNQFDVPMPAEEAWPILMDIERIAPCVPGAELTEIVDDKTYKGKVSVKLGPVALTFNGKTSFVEIDNDAMSAKLTAQGNDMKGRGGANAKVDFHMEPAEGGSRVVIHTNLQLSGAVAQYGRGVGMVSDLSQQIINQFAENLRNNVIAPASAAPVETTAPDADASKASETASAPKPENAAPVQVGSMGIKVLWNAITRGIRKLFGGS